jgi:hypothetical protein
MHKVIEVEGFDEELEAAIGTGPLPRIWSDRELAMLDRYYGKVNKELLLKKINRSWNAINKMASARGLTNGIRDN